MTVPDITCLTKRTGGTIVSFSRRDCIFRMVEKSETLDRKDPRLTASVDHDFTPGSAPGLQLTIEFKGGTGGVEATVSAVLECQWGDEVEATPEQLAEFYRVQAMPMGIGATCAIFVDEFRKYGVSISFPPPWVVQTMVDDALKELSNTSE